MTLVEAICLQIKDIDIENIYTLSYILKLYPPLYTLKSIRNHCHYIQRRLHGYAKIDTVELLYRTVLGECNLIGWKGPDMLLHDFSWRRLRVETYNTRRLIKHWSLEFKDPTTFFPKSDNPVLDCLMECGRILSAKLKLRGCGTEGIGMLKLTAYFRCERHEAYGHMEFITSEHFDIRNKSEIIWHVIYSLFTYMLNTNKLWCDLYTIRLYNISI